MKLGLMQPYFFPYLGYFDLIYQTDKWIVFDTVQYIRRGWINRNRVLHQNEGWQYINVPVKSHSRDSLIRDIEIASDGGKWQARIMGQLQHYKKNAPNYRMVTDLIEEAIAPEEPSISRLNTRCLELVCRTIGLPFSYSYLSEMDLNLGPINEPDDWALQVAAQLGAAEYVNPPGGADIYHADKFNAAGIKLTVRPLLTPLEYEPRGYEFVPHLSIIDLLMWNSPEQIKEHLEQNAN
jgi:hypothetical protein